MEVIQIVDNDHIYPHYSSIPSNWGEGVISLDGGQSDAMVTSDMVFAPLGASTISPAYYVLAEDGSIHPVLHENDLALFAQEYDDDEIPPHKLDHMYAKKPREPGSEVPKPVRRRVRKKEVTPNNVFVREIVDDGPPKINIIRQRHSMASYGPSRPKILSSPHKFSNVNQSTNSFSGSMLTTPTVVQSQKPKEEEMKEEEILPTDLGTEEFEDFNAPSPGAVVTVCDGVELDTDTLSSHALKIPKIVQYVTSVPHPAVVENRNLSLDSIGGPEDESELFFDFHMEEEVDGNIDVDFNEINPSCSVDILRDNSSFFPRDSVVDVSILLSSDSLEEPERVKDTPMVFTEVDADTSDCMPPETIVEFVPRKRGRPHKSASVIEKTPTALDDLSTDLATNTITPVRRSSRPVKLPSRLDDMDEIGTYGKRRR